MSDAPDKTLTLAIQVADPDMQDRLIAVLSSIDGIELVVANASADLVLSQPNIATDPAALPDLSAREEQVLAILAEGASNPEIAQRLGISLGTVKFHVRAIFDKLDATRRTDAVAHAARLGVIQL